MTQSAREQKGSEHTEECDANESKVAASYSDVGKISQVERFQLASQTTVDRVFETLLESWKLGVTNSWFIVDYNRQSLDKIMEEQSSKVIDRMFRLNGFEARARARARSTFLPRLTCRA